MRVAELQSLKATEFKAVASFKWLNHNVVQFTPNFSFLISITISILNNDSKRIALNLACFSIIIPHHFFTVIFSLKIFRAFN
jgi:hypothetical protein